MTATRSNSLPENYAYEDHGCDVAPHCTACPLPACKYEMTNYEAMAASTAAKYQRIVEARTANPDMTVPELATLLGISPRTLLRAAQMGRR